MKNTKTIVTMGLLIAIGVVLPMFARMIPNGGTLLSPLHIPALIAGIALGPVEGIIVGLVCPLLNYAISGMPQGAGLIAMCVELPVYGLVSGLMMRALQNRKDVIRVYVSLVTAMLVGRIAGGLVQAVVLGTGKYSLAIWATSYFVKTAPAIVIHLILIPAVYFALKKAKLVNN
jgi:ECF transporter S component (folate family)